VSEEIKEKERLRSLEVLSDVLDEFLEGRYDKFSISFDRPLELTENEYYELDFRRRASARQHIDVDLRRVGQIVDDSVGVQHGYFVPRQLLQQEARLLRGLYKRKDRP